jgi:hypothetical protein
MVIAVLVLTGCGGGSAPAGSSGGATAAAPAPAPTSPSSPGAGSPAASSPASGTVVVPGTFSGNVVLGSPTTQSIKVNVYAADASGSVTVDWGLSADALDRSSATHPQSAGQPLEITLEGLVPNQRHHYRVRHLSTDGKTTTQTAVASFHTARPAGSSFVFTIQGDSHPERSKSQFDAGLYIRTLNTAAADQPDFHILMGDDFSVDTLDPATINAAKVTERYTMQRPWLGLIGRSAPLFLVNGNHEQGARYLLDGTPHNVAVWAQNARNAHYSQPAPDAYYSGNPEVVPYIGLLRNHFAWTWGDALFVVIDPYWSSPVPVDNAFGSAAKRASVWEVTHGDAQYQWLKTTLERSGAKYKFVFAHHVMGTGRGGIELAGQYEWGGLNANGTPGFALQRPGWASPIHQLMVANRVTIFFQGHDHVWVKQQLDGIIYQTLPQPADPFYALNYADAYQLHLPGDKLPNSGYARVSVTPGEVKVEYVRSLLPADEGSGKVHGSVAHSYTVAAPAAKPSTAGKTAQRAGAATALAPRRPS